MDEIKIKAPRFSYLIPIPFVMLVMGVWYWVVFEREENVETEIKIISVLIMLVGGFLLYQFTRQFLKGPLIMLVNNSGFEYNPAGVSTQFIRWDEVLKMEEISVRVLRGSNTDGSETALGIWLKDPDAYLQQRNSLLRFLMKKNENLYGATLLIEPASLGKRYEEVKKYFELKLRIKNS